MAPNVTPHTVERIYAGQVNFNPTVQVLDIKKIQPNPGQNVSTERFRLVVSDGTHFQQAMLATQLNPLILNNQLQPNGLISLTEFICNDVQNKKIVIILGAVVVSPGLGYKVGEPVEYSKPTGGGTHMMGGRPPQAAPLSTMAGAPMAHHQPKQEGAPRPYQPGGAGSSAGGGGGSYQPTSAHQSSSAAPYGGGGGGYGGGGAAGGRQGGTAPVVRHEPGANIIPIADLNPYQNRWKVKARVTNKSDMKRWSNAKGEGTLFSIDMLDEHGGEIRAAFFKDACEKFFPVIKTGFVYTFSGGRLKVAQRQFSSIKNEYEITFDANSEIVECPDDQKIQTAIFNFKKINEMEQIAPNSTVDLIGIVKTFTAESTITTKKDGREVSKRELTIVDDSGTEVRMTLWGEKASNNPEQWENNPIVAFKGCKVSDFNGRSLGTLPASQVVVNPDLPEAVNLYNWWHSAGSTATTTSITGGGGAGSTTSFENRHMLSQIKDDHLGFGEKADYIDVKATIVYIKNEPDPWYKSCTNGDCKRKVTDQLGNYYCEKCQRTMSECAYRFILSMSATDHTGSSYLSCFDDQAQQILKKTAEELNNFKASEMQARYDATFQEANFTTYVFRLRCKAENVNDEQRVKSTIMGIRPVNLVQECRDMIQCIKSYN